MVNAPTLPASVRPHLRGLRHVGVVTDDREALIVRLQALFGVADDEIVRVPEADTASDTRFAFFSIAGLPFEVIEPVSPSFRTLLFASGRGVNHICFNVDDLPAAIAAMAAHGVRLGHVTADGIVELPHARMAYFNPEDTGGVLIEFVEPRT
jgi:catechol 2,3-dioxygenase-like lactoylglutathione lyase family enzyme